MALAAIIFMMVAAPCFSAAITVYVVDVEKVLTRSKAAQLGQAHLKDARKALEDGFEQLRRVWDKQPEEARQRILSDGANALSRQLALEQQAVNAVVTGMMLEEIRAWRKANRADIIMAKQGLLDASEAVDITANIMRGMDARQPKFADLPVVSVQPPNAGQAPPPRKK